MERKVRHKIAESPNCEVDETERASISKVLEYNLFVSGMGRNWSILFLVSTLISSLKLSSFS